MVVALTSAVIFFHMGLGLLVSPLQLKWCEQLVQLIGEVSCGSATEGQLAVVFHPGVLAQLYREFCDTTNSSPTLPFSMRLMGGSRKNSNYTAKCVSTCTPPL